MTGVDNPANDVQVRGDAFKTLFVARLSYDAKETDLEREFGRFGPIERVCTVYNRLGVAANVDDLVDTNYYGYTRWQWREVEEEKEGTPRVCVYCV